jgi:hypothetical protein
MKTYKSGIIFLFLITVSCATPMSNARKVEDISRVYYENVDINTAKEEKNGVSELVLQYGKSIPEWAAKKLIEKETKKYSANSKDQKLISLELSSNDPLSFPSFKDDTVGVIIFVRSIKQDIDKWFYKWFHDWFFYKWFDELHDAQDINVETFKNNILHTLKKNKIEIDNVDFLNDIKKLGKGVKLSFAGILLIRQMKSGRSFVIDLLAYKYPILKAKNSKWKIPFTDFHKTDSFLNITLEGPDGDRFFGKRFVSSHQFKVKWDRDKASDSTAAADWIEYTSDKAKDSTAAAGGTDYTSDKAKDSTAAAGGTDYTSNKANSSDLETIISRSQPIAIPLYPDLTIKVTLNEQNAFLPSVLDF